MKYDLISQINNKDAKLDIVNNEIKILHDSNIPELKGIRVNENGISSIGIPLISVDGKKFVLYNNNDTAVIESSNGIFCVSVSEECFFLQCGIENDIIKASFENYKLLVQIYTDVLKNGKYIDNLNNLIPDTIQTFDLEFKDEIVGKKNNKRILIVSDGEKKQEIKVPVHMSIINIIRLVSNVIRLEYRKNIGIKEIKRLIKQM